MLFLFPFIQHLPSLAKYFFESACSFPKRFKWRLPRRFCGQAIRPHNISTYPTQTPTFGKLELLHMWNVSQKKWLKWIRFTLIKWWLIEYTFSCWLNEKSLKRYCDKLQMTWNEWKPANKREEKKTHSAGCFENFSADEHTQQEGLFKIRLHGLPHSSLSFKTTW